MVESAFELPRTAALRPLPLALISSQAVGVSGSGLAFASDSFCISGVMGCAFVCDIPDNVCIQQVLVCGKRDCTFNFVRKRERRLSKEDKKANKKAPGILTDAMDKKTSENIGKSAKQSATDAANEIKQQYGSGRKPKGSRRGKITIEGNQAGEPFTFEYEEKVGDLVANYIEKANTPKKPKQATFLKDIANEIKAFAKETVPSKPKTTTKITAVDRLRDYLQNKDFYSNAWSNAQDALRRKYAGDPKMLEALSAFTDATIGFNGNPQAESRIMVKALVASAVESGETKAMLQTQEALGFTKMSENIANELIQKTGATGVDAEIIRSASSQYVNEVLKDSTLDAGKP